MKKIRRVGIIIQVRSSSKRFKNKFNKKINHQSIISFLINRILNYSNKINLIIAIPNKDKSLYCHIKKIKGIKIFFGDKNNVLDRYYKCALAYKLKTIVRLTGDNPLIDLELLFNSLKKHIKQNKKFTTNCIGSSFPNGFEFEILDRALLNFLWKNSFLKSEKEHVTPLIYKMIKDKKLKNKEFNSILDKNKKYKSLRLTIDKPIDLIVIKKINKLLEKDKLTINFKNIIKIYKKNKSIFSLNQKEIRDEGYKKSVINEKK